MGCVEQGFGHTSAYKYIYISVFIYIKSKCLFPFREDTHKPDTQTTNSELGT